MACLIGQAAVGLGAKRAIRTRLYAAATRYPASWVRASPR